MGPKNQGIQPKGMDIKARMMEVEKMSIKELKALLAECGVSAQGCLEREDLVARAKKLVDYKPRAAPVDQPAKLSKSQEPPPVLTWRDAKNTMSLFFAVPVLLWYALCLVGVMAQYGGDGWAREMFSANLG